MRHSPKIKEGQTDGADTFAPPVLRANAELCALRILTVMIGKDWRSNRHVLI